MLDLMRNEECIHSIGHGQVHILTKTTMDGMDPKTTANRIRQACDSCHGKKIRCIRGRAGHSTCARCLQDGLSCVYSPALRTGRPKKSQTPVSARSPARGHSSSSAGLDNFGDSDSASTLGSSLPTSAPPSFSPGSQQHSPWNPPPSISVVHSADGHDTIPIYGNEFAHTNSGLVSGFAFDNLLDFVQPDLSLPSDLLGDDGQQVRLTRLETLSFFHHQLLSKRNMAMAGGQHRNLGPSSVASAHREEEQDSRYLSEVLVLSQNIIDTMVSLSQEASQSIPFQPPSESISHDTSIMIVVGSGMLVLEVFDDIICMITQGPGHESTTSDIHVPGGYVEFGSLYDPIAAAEGGDLVSHISMSTHRGSSAPSPHENQLTGSGQVGPSVSNDERRRREYIERHHVHDPMRSYVITTMLESQLGRMKHLVETSSSSSSRGEQSFKSTIMVQYKDWIEKLSQRVTVILGSSRPNDDGFT
jgi:hypothetical protein